MKYFILLILLSAFRFTSNAQCDAAFTFISNGADVTFQASITGPNIEHAWNFNDGTFPAGTGASVNHRFGLPASYAVTHVVRSESAGCIDSVTSVVEVNFKLDCGAEFTITKDSIYPGKYMLLPKIINGVPTSYEWRLDGTVISRESPYVGRIPEGDHQICLKVMVVNCESSSCQEINVPKDGNCNWQASFSATPDVWIIKSSGLNQAFHPLP
jgi:hypothetical protein